MRVDASWESGEHPFREARRAAKRTWVTRRMKVDLPQPESACPRHPSPLPQPHFACLNHRYPPSCGHDECVEGGESTQRIQPHAHDVCTRASGTPRRLAQRCECLRAR